LIQNLKTLSQSAESDFLLEGHHGVSDLHWCKSKALTEFHLGHLAFIIMPILSLRLLFLSTCVAFGMASCSDVQTAPPEASAKYALTLKVTNDDLAAAIAQHYTGKVVAWYPEDGFAILGVNEVPNQDERWISLEENQANNNPEVLPNSDSTLPVPASVSSDGVYWRSGWSGWNSGSSVWAGGIKIWVTGDGALPTQQQNATIWNAVNLLEAWQASPKLGEGIKVAVIDTGIDTMHPVFHGRLAPQSEWHDFISSDDLPQEDGQYTDAAFGHGTGVAGLIAQVAPKAQIMPLRVLDANGQGNELDLVAAIAWAIDKHADVINLSLGSEKSSGSVNHMIKAASKLGIVVVASAGNNSLQKSNFPASSSRNYANVVAVASSSISVNPIGLNPGSLPYSYTWAWYSNYGPDISVVAPGENLFTPFPGNAGKTWNGTSFSTALTSGAMALRMAQGPLTSSATMMLQASVIDGLSAAPDPAAKSKVLCSCGEIDIGKLQKQ
jgi:thermitase